MLTRQRCSLTALAATATAAGVLRLLVSWAAPLDTRPDAALVDLCLAALGAATVWAWLSAMSAVAEVWRGRAPGPGRSRSPIRRLVLACCGVALVAPSPALADDQHPAPVSIDGLPMPDRAVGPAHHRHHADATSVVVGPGDCLWHLAAAGLPADATTSEIAARWHAIYRLNRTTIGADPNLIRPGQRLVLPRR